MALNQLIVEFEDEPALPGPGEGRSVLSDTMSQLIAAVEAVLAQRGLALMSLSIKGGSHRGDGGGIQ